MDNFEEDPAADFLAREQDDLAELGEDFGGGGAETNVSLVTPWSDEILETEQADFFWYWQRSTRTCCSVF